MLTVQNRPVSANRKDTGTLLITLDFELYWGVRDQLTKKAYAKNILGVQSVVPALLELFKQYKIHATWAIVGFLFFKNKQELIAELPEKFPGYTNQNLSPYPYIDTLDSIESEDPFHFAPSLIKRISTYPDQEIGTHTFSHYYCLEKGQTIDEFEEDLKKAITIAKRFGWKPKSIVFPRNQVNPEYLPVLRKLGITSYRGNESSWLYKPTNQDDRRFLKRGLRLIDSYLNLSGHNTYAVHELNKEVPLNLPSSRFLRPYAKRFRIFESMRLRRICSDLTYAAKKGEIYHLWWHPHNFGANLDENVSFLKKIFDHFLNLKMEYGMKSMNMGELSRKIRFQQE
ncbi:polysaccharide deacetylase family protein [Thermoflavimicrobium dichotomicum]|uniref:polysaccharide deacetylase family protein n=1 Tax=Thermoflavimicrobium dichotomicum TaxID=46223 RepID=UPI001FDFF440|nr:polysaccharide deacetylase family protein [Thermoflavimicrobium dichotomicum]